MKIASLPGDGIGKEVVPEALKVLEAASRRFGFELEVEHLPYGADHYLETGVTLPEAEFERLPAHFDAIFLGGLGDPRVENNIHARDILLGLRFRLDLYINFRPIKLWRESLCPLKDKSRADVDFVVFRENTEGLYSGAGGQMHKGTADEVATQVMICTRKGVERILRAAFEYARAKGKRRLCMSDKANALGHVGDLWRRTFEEVSAQYPEIETRVEYIDALCMHLVRVPEQFDVIVTGNMFGDIVTDMGASLQGGMGMAISANLHPGRIGLYEPVHGTAPDIYGKGLANPLAAILTGALMLEHHAQPEAARAIELCVEKALDAGQTTKDLGGTLSTSSVTEAILSHLAEATPPGSRGE